jgi:NADH:ubiquinone oxidoreductase subunit 3 (subunit A)
MRKAVLDCLGKAECAGRGRDSRLTKRRGSLSLWNMTPDPYFFLVIFAGVALVFPLMPLAVAWVWRRFLQPPKPGPQKNATYECGVESLGEAQVQFQSQYYLYCIIFLIFDVEAIFLVPFAVAFTGLPLGAFIAILVFLLLLLEGLVWAWSKGCLDWAQMRKSAS